MRTPKSVNPQAMAISSQVSSPSHSRSRSRRSGSFPSLPLSRHFVPHFLSLPPILEPSFDASTEP